MSFKEDLGEALVKAVGYFNGGCDPNEAIVKSAKDMHFNLDQMDRLVEKFNTARTINYFENNPDDRTQNFDIASKEKVAEYLFGDQAEKKASAGGYADEWYDYSSYDRADRNYFDTGTEKSAEAAGKGDSAKDDASDVKGYSTDSICRLILKRADEHRRQADFIRSQIGMIEAEATSELSKVASMVVSGYEPWERYAVVKSVCGDLSSFKAMDGLVPDTVKKEAEASLRALKRVNVVDLGDLEEAVDSLRTIDKIASEVKSFEKEATVHETYRANIIANLEKIAAGSGGNSKNDEYSVAREFLNLGNNIIGKPAKSILSTEASLSDTLGGKGLSDYIDTGFLGSREDIQKAVTPPKKKDTSLSEHINNLRRSTILQDLYENDPILQEADPNALADAYQTVVQTAPDMSLNKEVVRAILRQSVNSMAVSPFDAKQWADLENVLKKNRGLIKDVK